MGSCLVAARPWIWRLQYKSLKLLGQLTHWWPRRLPWNLHKGPLTNKPSKKDKTTEKKTKKYEVCRDDDREWIYFPKRSNSCPHAHKKKGTVIVGWVLRKCGVNLRHQHVKHSLLNQTHSKSITTLYCYDCQHSKYPTQKYKYSKHANSGILTWWPKPCYRFFPIHIPWPSYGFIGTGVV